MSTKTTKAKLDRLKAFLSKTSRNGGENRRDLRNSEEQGILLKEEDFDHLGALHRTVIKSGKD